MTFENHPTSTLWIDPLHDERIRVYGFHWLKQNQNYYRLPYDQLDYVATLNPKVAELASNTSGGQLHFRTDSRFLKIRATITGFHIMPGMTPVGIGGFDCYVGPDLKNVKFFDSSRFDPSFRDFEYTFFKENQVDVLVIINFPLYAGVEKIEVGIEEGSQIQNHSSFQDDERIVVYGTSITQGGCASRAGMSYTNILSRRMGREWLNFGFSGSAFGEHGLIEILSEIDKAKMYLIDYEANSGTNGLLIKTLEDIIFTIRHHHPTTLIVVLSRIPYVFDELDNTLAKRRSKIREFQRNIVKKLKLLGDHQIHFIDGSKLLGSDYHECTVDSIHPNDLGFMRIAENLEPRLNRILYR